MIRLEPNPPFSENIKKYRAMTSNAVSIQDIIRRTQEYEAQYRSSTANHRNATTECDETTMNADDNEVEHFNRCIHHYNDECYYCDERNCDYDFLANANEAYYDEDDTPVDHDYLDYTDYPNDEAFSDNEDFEYFHNVYDKEYCNSPSPPAEDTNYEDSPTTYNDELLCYD